MRRLLASVTIGMIIIPLIIQSCGKEQETPNTQTQTSLGRAFHFSDTTNITKALLTDFKQATKRLKTDIESLHRQIDLWRKASHQDLTRVDQDYIGDYREKMIHLKAELDTLGQHLKALQQIPASNRKMDIAVFDSLLQTVQIEIDRIRDMKKQQEKIEP